MTPTLTPAEYPNGGADTRSTRPPDKRQPVCAHSEHHWQVSPYDGDVWCFACKPPRNLSEDLRRIEETLLDQEPIA